MQALGLIETKGLIAAIESADAMLKAANVSLLEKTYVGGGLVSIAITGDVGAVKAAVEAGAAAVRNIGSTLLVSEHVIPRPHEDISELILSTNIVIEESIKEEIAETPVDIAANVIENLEVAKVEVNDLVEEALIKEEQKVIIPSSSSQINFSQLHNKEAVDKMILESGLDVTIGVLSKFKVIELRNLAREYKNFGIAGRRISKADKNLLLTEFRKYYSHN